MKSANRVVDPVLTQLGMEYRQAQTNFVQDSFAPWVQTEGDTGTYYIADALNNLGVEDNTWSYTGGAKRVDSVFTSAAFKAKPYALEEAVPDAFVRNWLAGGDDLKVRATSGLQDKMLLAREIRIEAIVNAITLGSSLASGGPRWDSTAPNPRADIKLGSGTILKRIGRGANTVTICGSVWDSITGTHSAGTAGALILDAIKYTRPGLGSAITAELVAQYFNVDYVLPAVAVRSATTTVETTTANANGLAAAGIYVWQGASAASDEVYVSYVERNPGPQSLSNMLTFGPDLSTMDQYREDRVMADIVRCTQTVVEATTCSTAIYAFGTVIG